MKYIHLPLFWSTHTCFISCLHTPACLLVYLHTYHLFPTSNSRLVYPYLLYFLSAYTCLSSCVPTPVVLSTYTYLTSCPSTFTCLFVFIHTHIPYTLSTYTCLSLCLPQTTYLHLTLLFVYLHLDAF